MREPGRQVPKQQAREIIGQFWSRYRDPAKKGGPTWLRFRSMVRVGADILRSSVLDGHQELYVVFEHERALWVASPADVRRYFEQRGPGDYADVYVLPLYPFTVNPLGQLRGGCMLLCHMSPCQSSWRPAGAPPTEEGAFYTSTYTVNGYLPLTMDWCIAYTAEESGGNDVVLLSGDVEPFGR